MKFSTLLALALSILASVAHANPIEDVVAIDSGSAVDVGGFHADVGFSGGATYTNTMPINRANVSDPAPEAVYQSARFGGTFNYLLTGMQAGAKYKVKLHFCELYWNSPGARIFQVNANGVPALTNFDILAAAGGKGIAVVREITTEANNLGNIILDFTTIQDNAQINGIEVVQDVPTPPVPSPSYNLSLGADRSSYLVGQHAQVMVSLLNRPENPRYEFFVSTTFNGSALALTRITDTQLYGVTPALAAGASQVVASLFLQDKSEAAALEQSIAYYSSEISRLTTLLGQTSDATRRAAIQAEIDRDQSSLDATKDHLNHIRTPIGAPVSISLIAQ